LANPFGSAHLSGLPPGESFSGSSGTRAFALAPSGVTVPRVLRPLLTAADCSASLATRSLRFCASVCVRRHHCRRSGVDALPPPAERLLSRSLSLPASVPQSQGLSRGLPVLFSAHSRRIYVAPLVTGGLRIVLHPRPSRRRLSSAGRPRWPGLLCAIGPCMVRWLLPAPLTRIP
jgi:hypothetical protein